MERITARAAARRSDPRRGLTMRVVDPRDPGFACVRLKVQPPPAAAGTPSHLTLIHQNLERTLNRAGIVRQRVDHQFVRARGLDEFIHARAHLGGATNC